MAKNKTSPARKKKTWKEMSPSAKAGTIIVGIAQMSLLVAAQRDISRRPAAQINGPKAAWRAASFINFIGPMGYFIFGRKRLPGAK
ncbi:PLDc N-terminal domain-containing protein [Arthrobacter nitrophenolicus]|jgi:hypothetical protein|uniref:Cardiolipin synthase N-terminal domain-containing protein n=2 Tax=Arthrobacter nitrophenolicus TaxID=683150 RepID=L8TUJ8_9MICC|nr:PLDc N-terminal domain-containing protein [Arthrobacter nitrophenolicus]ELT45421.1 hypothetical protein G205_05181 [Arthrobacter nitrophenolicus]TDL33198.1 hypothetical protein E2R57_18505 [Arthrobacter nitrophenolicus]